ncbi:guanine deaminase [Shewanella psychropiezotolerans]|uniref:Guanine deaminase n=1 Tax=Shewanella psychropiezotolerans TaxID=2593655 RepID=A0ABX5WW22_9GAMM|nr:guanine deaminase [Shewanella psychropiezotolerans]QDO83288.1 guanine deaminase [Shewanella psychropiezotolerans]
MGCNHTIKVIRASFLDILSVVDDPADIEKNLRFIEDGLMFVANGRIEWIGTWEEGKDKIPADVRVRSYPGKIVMPGFIDTHIHYPQSEMVGAYGEQLLEWLDNYVFPTEARYKDKDYAKEMSEFFVKQLLRNGTTTAMVFGTVHPESVNSLFEVAENINMRMIAGKVMMDRNAPDYLLDTPEISYNQSKELIEKWHKRGRLLYAITPRFAPTSSPEQLDVAGRLKQEFPDTYVHTHLCENKDEIKWVKELFPERASYLDVYHHHGLTGPKSIFAHSIHLEDCEWDCLHETDSAVSFCPTSNLYLGSGLFKLQEAWKRKVKVGVGTDIGAGTTFSMMQTLNEAYKVMQLQDYRLSAFEAFYLATLGGAKSLSLDHLIGNFEIGKEADFVVIDPCATPLQQLRYDNSKSLADELFVLITLSDDRSIYRTYVDGQLVYARN